MGISVESNSILALRAHGTPGVRGTCLPEKLEAGKTYGFFKRGYRIYQLGKEIPLVSTNGNTRENDRFSRPKASVIILRTMQFLRRDSPCTTGKYFVKEVYDPSDPTIHFEGMSKIERLSSGEIR